MTVPSHHTKIGAWVNSKMSGRNLPLYCTTVTLLIAMQVNTRGRNFTKNDDKFVTRASVNCVRFSQHTRRMVPYRNGCKALCLLSAWCIHVRLTQSREAGVLISLVIWLWRGHYLSNPALFVFVLCRLLFASGSPPRSLGWEEIRHCQ